MDKPTRNLISNATQAARRLLEGELAQQLEGVYDILPDGSVAEGGGSHLGLTERLVRDKIAAVLAHKRAGGKSPAEAVDDYLREAAFTCLNRFVALKMLEARELIRECVSRGDTSSGFREFCGLASGLASLPDKGYRLYVESLFDELSTEIKVLFDRHDPASLLWPRRQALVDLLAILNAPELAAVWGEDETIGWVYQYFNSGDERKKMREESQAPRNSRELAVRNQFFTPRYVVQFLTDNTLGRIWYEMRRCDTALVDRCAYLVRDQEAVAERPKKDPRDIRLLDPAGGSGHFLLYAFDLFLVVYEEAWHDPGGPRSKATGRSLREDYPDLGALRRALPALILEHNLHAVDIDPRCVQIAALALWMRAQRAYKDFGLPANERGPITRIHVVVAEPMPGDEAMVESFAATLEPPLLGGLFKKMVGEMHLAGELGTLLRVEGGIASEIQRAREQFVAREKLLRTGFLPGMEPAYRQGELDLSGIDDAEFFHQAEARIVEALRLFAETAAGSSAMRRRMFAGDAAQGVALIDILQNRFDVVLMNPPFGEPSTASKTYLFENYSISKYDLASAFAQRTGTMLTARGIVGSLTNRSVFFGAMLGEWRRHQFVSAGSLSAFADLGVGVLDGALVEAVAYTFSSSQRPLPTPFLKVTSHGREAVDQGEALRAAVTNQDWLLRFVSTFQALPDFPFAYWTPSEWLEAFSKFPPLESHGIAVKQGMESSDNFRFVRLWWEPRPGDRQWRPYSKGGWFGPQWRNLDVVVNWGSDGEEVKAYSASIYGTWTKQITNTEFYGRPGLCYPASRVEFSPRVLPRDCVVGCKGPIVAFEAATPLNQSNYIALLALMSSSPFRALVNLTTTSGDTMRKSYRERAVASVPTPALGQVTDTVRATTETIIESIRTLESSEETCRSFLCVNDRENRSLLAATIRLERQRLDDQISNSYGFRGANYVAYDRTGYDDLQEYTLETRDGILSYALGTAFGRWDVRFATGQKTPPELPDPFAPLAICPPGQLQNEQGLPISNGDVARHLAAQTWGYPLDIPWDGILVDDQGHALDIAARVRHVLELLWKDESDSVEHATCESLAVRTLRDYFRKSLGFFADHIKRYSRSRRQAPVYWQLATASSSYSAWLYYHRLTRDTLFKLLNNFVTPKLLHEQQEQFTLAQGVSGYGTAGQRAELATQESFVDELRAFRDEVERVAPLWNPDLDDGVIINFAPLWRLVPQNKPWQKECKACWDKLVAGGYDWAHLAMHLWPERVVPKCASDRSLAIAHRLEDVFWEKDDSGKWQPRHVSQARVEELVRERTSPAVKAALQSLLDAPSTAPGRGPRAPRRPAVARPMSRPLRPAADRARSVRAARGPAASDETLSAVRDAIAASQGGASRADVIASTGISGSEWNATISALLERGEVVKTGEKRGTRYFVKGGLSA